MNFTASTLRLASLRVAFHHLNAEWHRIAKPKYLKTLDWMLGLIRSFDKDGYQISADLSNRNMLRRVIRMRQAVQDGFDLALLIENDEIMEGAGAKAMGRLQKAVKEQAQLQPTDTDLAAFVKTYADKEDGARRTQGEFFKKLIAKELELGKEEVANMDTLVMSDRPFFDACFNVVNQYVNARKNRVASALSSAPGEFKMRDKANTSTWNKSRRGKKPRAFYYLGDLLGCMSVTTSIPDMAHACEVAQSSIKIIAKDNKYLDTQGGYNAVHYALLVDKLVVEYQVKAKVSAMEAAISHDLVHDDDKFRAKFKPTTSAPEGRIPLSSAEKDMVKRVIDISTQLTMRDFEQAFDLGLMTGGQPIDPTDLLYGEGLSPEELKERIHMASLRMARYYRFWEPRFGGAKVGGHDPYEFYEGISPQHPPPGGWAKWEAEEKREAERKEKKLHKDVAQWMRRNARGKNIYELIDAAVMHFGLRRPDGYAYDGGEGPRWVHVLADKYHRPYD